MLDAVVYHLDVVSGAAFAHNTHAWLFVLVFCGHLLKQRHNFLQCRQVAARAHGGASSCGLISATDSAANVADARVLDFVLSALGVGKMLVAAVEDDVIAGQVRHEALEHFVADTTVWEGEDEKSRRGEGLAQGFIVYQLISAKGYCVRVSLQPTTELVDLAIVS
jgi:hypothetical protein